MYFDNRSFALTDIAIANAIAENLDDGQPKPNLIAVLRKLVGRKRERTSPVSDYQGIAVQPEAVQTWR